MIPEYNSGEQDCGIVGTSMMFEAENLGVYSDSQPVPLHSQKCEMSEIVTELYR